jgi:hypothetical protein
MDDGVREFDNKNMPYLKCRTIITICCKTWVKHRIVDDSIEACYFLNISQVSLNRLCFSKLSSEIRKYEKTKTGFIKNECAPALQEKPVIYAESIQSIPYCLNLYPKWTILGILSSLYTIREHHCTVAHAHLSVHSPALYFTSEDTSFMTHISFGTGCCWTVTVIRIISLIYTGTFQGLKLRINMFFFFLESGEAESTRYVGH